MGTVDEVEALVRLHLRAMHKLYHERVSPGIRSEDYQVEMNRLLFMKSAELRAYIGSWQCPDETVCKWLNQSNA